jgi:hypothetical protein
MSDFIQHAPLFSRRLALLQELCLNKKIAPMSEGKITNLFDLEGGR